MELLNNKNTLNIEADVIEDLFVRLEVVDNEGLPVDLTDFELRAYLRQQGKRMYEYKPFTTKDLIELNVFYLDIKAADLQALQRKDGRVYQYYITLKNTTGETKCVSGQLFLS